MTVFLSRVQTDRLTERQQIPVVKMCRSMNETKKVSGRNKPITSFTQRPETQEAFFYLL